MQFQEAIQLLTSFDFSKFSEKHEYYSYSDKRLIVANLFGCASKILSG